MYLQLQNLESAVSDVGKTILPEHLLLVANTLSVTGNFVGLTPKGLARQREHASVASPFSQACFSVSSHYLFAFVFAIEYPFRLNMYMFV